MAKASTQTKVTKTNETVSKKEVVTTPVVEAAPAKKSKKAVEPVAEAVAPVVEAAPAKKSKKAVAPVEPVVEAVPSKKSKKSAATVEVEVVAPVTTKASKKGASKKAAELVDEVVAPVAAKAPKKGAAKKAAKKEVKEEQQETVRTVGHRFFRCVYKTTDDEIVHVGRYSGNKPKQAACKALTGIVKNNGLETGEKVTFLIQECTRGSKKKKYSYVGCQVDLPEPVRITITKKDGSSSQIEYTKNNDVKKISLSECGDLLNVDLAEDNEVEEAKVARVEKKVKTTKNVAKEATAPVKAAKSSKAKKTH
jgi:hypothetical protein